MSDSGTARRPVPSRHAVLTLFMVLVFGLLTLPVFTDTVRHDLPEPARGAVTYPADALADAPVSLAGEWRVVWRSAPGGGGPSGYAAMPGDWAGVALNDGRRLPGFAQVSYELEIGGLAPGRYRLYQAPVFGASRVSIDGETLSTHGRVGIDHASTRYAVRAHDVSFESSGGTLRLRIDVATFRDIGNGVELAPILGSAAPMQRWMALAWAKEMLIDASLAMIGLFAMIVYLNRRQDRAALFVALGSLALLVILLIYGFEGLVLVVFPGTPHEPVYAILTLTCILALVAWLAYIDVLFPVESWRPVARGLMIACSMFALAQLLAFPAGGTILASQVNRAFPFAFLVTVLYVALVSTRAFFAGRSGANYFMIGQISIIVAFAMQILVNFAQIGPDLAFGVDFASYGFLVFMFTHLMVLAERWSAAIDAAETLNDDLSQLLDVNSAVTSEARLETLLTRIVGVTSRILNAERSTLFLHDGQKSQLWSLVAEGMETREIRIADNSGIAGHVFQANAPERVQDAYADPRFAADIDAATGFRTRNLLAAPVVARDGRKLGVLQALNNLGGGGFSAADEARLGAFAAQAAIAIDNATLFSEVVASRNYNESILQSMSSGVVTLQEEGRQARLNHAAARILKVSRDQAEGANARAFLKATNPGLIPEIDAVAESGEPKSLLDTDLVTSTGETVSANISIVPLRDEERTTGVLLMLDDISASKRLEGAMRRFMTQEIMDQVLAEGGDQLFGSACDASVLFADIRNFTSLAERLSPRETVDMLNEIFTDLFEAVADAEGVLDKYIGDAIMAVFGAPISSGRDARNAVEAALRMQEMMAAINARRALRDANELRLGIGIASGEVIAGTIGSPKRMDYTVIGDRVNLASRLQDATKTYSCGIIVCERTARLVAGHAALREIDRIKVKGRETQETIFEVTGRA